MKTHSALCCLLACAATVPATLLAQNTPSPASSPTSIPTPLVYRNLQYGFCFRLPADWKGYTIVTQQWSGTMLTGPDAGKQTENGPQLLIRNPKWTEGDPYKDIPIMVFTPSQWKLADGANADMAVSAAPIGPAELGQNKSYVFALPPRWIGFYDVKGIDEVQALMNQNPFEAPCGHKSTQPDKNVP